MYGQTIVQGHWQGVIGCFIKADGAPVSPILKDLAELYPWMRANGWFWDEHGTTPGGDAGKFYPWRVRKIEGAAS